MPNATNPGVSAPATTTPTVPTVSVRQTAEFLGVNPKTVRVAIREGQVPGFVFGRRPNYRGDRAALLKAAGLPLDTDFDAQWPGTSR